jgi:hypothetical protein
MEGKMIIQSRLTATCRKFHRADGQMDCICTLRLTAAEWTAEGIDDADREEKVKNRVNLRCLSACDGHQCSTTFTPENGGRLVIGQCVVSDPTANVILTADDA